MTQTNHTDRIRAAAIEIALHTAQTTPRSFGDSFVNELTAIISRHLKGHDFPAGVAVCVAEVQKVRDMYDAQAKAMRGLHGEQKYAYMTTAATEAIKAITSLTDSAPSPAQEQRNPKLDEIWARQRDNFRELGSDEWRGQYAADVRYLFSLITAASPAQEQDDEPLNEARRFVASTEGGVAIDRFYAKGLIHHLLWLIDSCAHRCR